MVDRFKGCHWRCSKEIVIIFEMPFEFEIYFGIKSWAIYIDRLPSYSGQTLFYASYIFLDMLFSTISVQFESRIFQIQFFRAGNSNIAITMVYKAKGLYSMYSHHELRSGIYSKESRAAGAKASREVLFLSGHNWMCGAILAACSCLRLCSPLCLVTFSQCHV